MILFIDQKNEIKDVNTTTNNTLIPFEVDDSYNPFKDWSTAKICCHAIEIKDGKLNGFYPYVDVNIIRHIDDLANGNEANATDITDTQIGLTETYQKALKTDATVTDIQLALVELYEMILGGK